MLMIFFFKQKTAYEMRISDWSSDVCSSDLLVNRRFTAAAPRRLWVCDVTYVATWSGFAYVAFVTDVYSRRIVGWNVASTLRAEILPMQAQIGRAACRERVCQYV